jgi:hypothetical protein
VLKRVIAEEFITSVLVHMLFHHTCVNRRLHMPFTAARTSKSSGRICCHSAPFRVSMIRSIPRAPSTVESE